MAEIKIEILVTAEETVWTGISGMSDVARFEAVPQIHHVFLTFLGTCAIISVTHATGHTE